MQISKPVDEIFYQRIEYYLWHETQEDRLISRMIDIPSLQSQANIVLAQFKPGENDQHISELIRSAKQLDLAITDWAESLPAAWAYTIATNLDLSSRTSSTGVDFYPSHIHRYSDFSIARIWNLYRISRLIILSIVLRAASKLWPRLSNHKRDTDRIQVGRQMRELVDDICASVPFLSNQDLSRMALKLAKHGGRPDGMSEILVKKARNSLIWPLYLGCSVPSLPDNQQTWMRTQLRRLGELGEPQATLLSGSKCQTLSGGVERFRFYCV